MPAEQVRQDAFLDADGHGLIADVHLGWPAADGRLLTRPGGGLGDITENRFIQSTSGALGTTITTMRF